MLFQIISYFVIKSNRNIYLSIAFFLCSLSPTIQPPYYSDSTWHYHSVPATARPPYNTNGWSNPTWSPYGPTTTRSPYYPWTTTARPPYNPFSTTRGPQDSSPTARPPYDPYSTTARPPYDPYSTTRPPHHHNHGGDIGGGGWTDPSSSGMSLSFTFE